MTIYLYKKTHNKTGLQYLGKTVRDPFKYTGSGLDWKMHLQEHGSDVSTEILKECSSTAELSYWGRYYSDLWNVVESTDWANKTRETGGGPGVSSKQAKLTARKLLSNMKHNFQGEANPTYKRIEERTHNFLGPEHNKARMKNGTHPSFIKIRCCHCGKIGDKGNMIRWHGDNCKQK
jgi:hypothetical protein